MASTTEHIATPVRVAVDTLAGYLRHKTEPIFTKDVLMAGMKAHGRIKHKQVGMEMDWPVRFRRREISGAAGYDQGIDGPRTNTRRRVQLPWRRHRLAESLTKFERLANAGDAALHKIVDGIVGECVDDFMVSYRKQLFKDGNVTGTTDLHGFESIFSYNGLINASAKCGLPNDVYAGTQTAPAYYGGSWTPDVGDYWPTGEGSTEYGFFTPLIVDSTNTNWTAATKTWGGATGTWQECIRFTLAYMEQNQDEVPNMCLMSTQRLIDAKQSLESKQQFELTQNSPLTELSFKTLSYDGLELYSQSGVPTGVTYLFNWDRLSLRSMLGQLIDVETEKDPNDSSTIYYFDAFTNMQMDSPAFFAKILDIS